MGTWLTMRRIDGDVFDAAEVNGGVADVVFMLVFRKSFPHSFTDFCRQSYAEKKYHKKTDRMTILAFSCLLQGSILQ